MHIPVLLENVLQIANPNNPLIKVLDCTFGRGGYSRAFLEKGCFVTALDRDETAQPFADALKNEFKDNFQFIQSKFSALGDLFEPQSFDIIVFDIGVSSPQLDEAHRGFSFGKTGVLDMRMGSSTLTAADIVNTYSAEKLADIFFYYGEERKSRKFARLICDYRIKKPFETTTELAELIAKNSPKVFHKKKKMHPATLIFQALRIAVNDELNEFETALNRCHYLLKTGGRLLTVTFHSLEDRIAKNYFKTYSFAEKQSKYVTDKIQATNLYELITKKPITASETELKNNPRASSAKLRGAIRTDVAG
jgi:16S rRNA (cytosine1402-N4)-methyltransferase